MAREIKAIDIADLPEVLRLAEEVQASNEPLVLRRDRKDVAIVVPIKRTRARPGNRAKTEADFEAFRSAAGGWKDVDTDKLIADIYVGRARGYRPPVKR